MSFAALTARRHASIARRFASNAAGELLKVFFPTTPGARATEFPDAVTAMQGQTNKADKDVSHLLDQKKSTHTISVITAELPAAYRRGDRDSIPKQQILKLGHTIETAVSYKVTSSSSAAGITQIEFDSNT